MLFDYHLFRMFYIFTVYRFEPNIQEIKFDEKHNAIFNNLMKNTHSIVENIENISIEKYKCRVIIQGEYKAVVKKNNNPLH